jgi:hypothetical protein
MNVEQALLALISLGERPLTAEQAWAARKRWQQLAPDPAAGPADVLEPLHAYTGKRLRHPGDDAHADAARREFVELERSLLTALIPYQRPGLTAGEFDALDARLDAVLRRLRGLRPGLPEREALDHLVDYVEAKRRDARGRVTLDPVAEPAALRRDQPIPA